MLSDFIAPETVVLLAGAALTIGYLIIHQVMLRLMVLLGTALYIVYYAIVADTPCREHSELSGVGNMPIVRFS